MGNWTKICRRLLYLLMLSFSFGIPIYASPALSWSIWPTLSDLVVGLIGFVLFIETFVGRQRISFFKLPRWSGTAFLSAIFLVLTCFAGVLSLVLNDAPTSQWGYASYVYYRFVQAYIIIAAFWRVSDAQHAEKCLQLLGVSASICAVACVAQHFGVLDYRQMVAHLNVGNAGPWGFRFTELPDAALGTWNFNRINVAHFLVTVAFMMVLSHKISLRRLLLAALLVGGVVATQSRTVLLVVVAAATTFMYIGGRMKTALSVALLSIAMAVGYRFYSTNFADEAAIQYRSETVGESFEGRFGIQQQALDWWMNSSIEQMFFGVGLGNTGYFAFGTGFMPAHGQYITLLVEAGMVGSVIFMVCALSFISALSHTTPLQTAVKSVLVGIFVSAIFNDILFPSPTFAGFSSVLATIFGWSLVSDRMPHPKGDK